LVSAGGAVRVLALKDAGSEAKAFKDVAVRINGKVFAVKMVAVKDVRS
jgi:hypothetical protein